MATHVAHHQVEAHQQHRSDRGARGPGGPRRRRFPWYAYLGLLPTFALLGTFAYYPAVSGVVHSFFAWRPGFDSPFVGLANYREMLGDDLWWSSFRNLGYIFLASVTVMWFFPLLAAELVVSLRSARLQFAFRTLLIAPLAFPGVVTALVWSFVLDPNDGMLNRGLQAIGLGALAHNWVGEPGTALPALLLIGFPWIASLPFLVFLTALQNIPKEVLEAAALDGCGRLRRVFAVDLPLMAAQLKLLFFLATISVLQFGFAAYLVTGGGPDNATQVPVLRMIGVAFQGSDWGYAATLSTCLFAITAALSGALMAVRRKEARDVRGL